MSQAMRIVNIDEDPISRNGISVTLQQVIPNADVRDMTFDEALACSDWDDVDYVVLDLAHLVRDDPTADEYPSVGVARHIRMCARNRGPWVIVVTSEVSSKDSPF